MPVRMILISTFIAELLCFGKSNTCCGFLGYFSEAFHSEEMPFKAHKMAPTFVNATLNILSKPKSSPGIDPSQSNYLSSKMSLHIYGKSDFVNPENIAAFLAFFQQIRTHPRTIIVLRSRGEKTVLKTSLVGTKYCVTMIAILIPTAS